MSNAQKVSDERLASMLTSLNQGPSLNDYWPGSFSCEPQEMWDILTELQSLRAAPTPDAPERDPTNLLSVIADIREKSGLGAGPMLSELADAVGAKCKSPTPDAHSEVGVTHEYDPDAPPDHSADNAADFIFRELSSALEVDGKWYVSDGTETWDGDVRGTLYAILKAAGIWDDYENKLIQIKARATAGVVKAEPVAWQKADALEPFLAVARNVVDHPAQYQGTLMRSGGLSTARDLDARDFARLLEAFAALASKAEGER